MCIAQSDPRCIPEALDRWPRSMSLLTMTSQAVYYVSELPPRTIVAKRKIGHNPPSNIPTQGVRGAGRPPEDSTVNGTRRTADIPATVHIRISCAHANAAGAPNEPTHANGIIQTPPKMRCQTKTSIPADWVQATKISTHRHSHRPTLRSFDDDVFNTKNPDSALSKIKSNLDRLEGLINNAAIKNISQSAKDRTQALANRLNGNAMNKTLGEITEVLEKVNHTT